MMVSGHIEAVHPAWADTVSILLVMDDGLWGVLNFSFICCAHNVSILLVMDDGLWDCFRHG